MVAYTDAYKAFFKTVVYTDALRLFSAFVAPNKVCNHHSIISVSTYFICARYTILLFNHLYSHL